MSETQKFVLNLIIAHWCRVLNFIAVYLCGRNWSIHSTQVVRSRSVIIKSIFIATTENEQVVNVVCMSDLLLMS